MTIMTFIVPANRGKQMKEEASFFFWDEYRRRRDRIQNIRPKIRIPFCSKESKCSKQISFGVILRIVLSLRVEVAHSPGESAVWHIPQKGDSQRWDISRPGAL